MGFIQLFKEEIEEDSLFNIHAKRKLLHAANLCSLLKKNHKKRHKIADFAPFYAQYGAQSPKTDYFHALFL